VSQVSDTSPEAMRVLIDCYRKMPGSRKWKLLVDAYRYAGVLHAAGMRARNPGVSEAEIRRHWAATTLGQGPGSSA
jgi:hypothetical protein